MKSKPRICTKCGKRRVIEFVCIFGMDDVDPQGIFRKPKKRELCRPCTNRKNKCRHPACLQNYRESYLA